MTRIALLLVCVLTRLGFGESVGANPIRKVVVMLQDMQKAIVSEGEKEKELHEAFMCQCKSGAASLEESIKTGSAQVEALTGTLETDAAQKSQLEQDTVQHKADLAAAKAAIKESTAMRGKEAAEFAASSGEMKSNVEAMRSALAALKKGLSASMLQTSVGQTLRSIIQQSPAVNDDERGSLMEFLETGEGGSDQIIGIVETMMETMEADLKESVATEDEAKASFATLVASKESEISAAQKAVEGKTARVGELAVSLVQAKADLGNTKDALADDEKMKANLATSCTTKTAEFDELAKTRAMEVQAVSETIEMLNSDEALELMKKTLPSAPAFLQVSAGMRLRQRSLLKAKSPPKFLMMQVRNGQGLKNVVGDVIGKLIAANEKKQADDEKQREFCLKELAAVEADVKKLKTDVSDGNADVPVREDAVATLKSEIDALQQGLLDLDKSVAEATEQRKAEHAEYLQTSQSNQAAKELIGMAKNRMAKFYSPSEYKAPAATPQPAFLQYKKQEAGGVMSMMAQIIGDIDLEVAEAKHDEESAQKDYEEAMKDAVAKRSADSKMIVEKTDQKATEATNLESAKEELRTSEKMLGEAEKKSSYTHGMCDTFLKNFEEKQSERASQNAMLKENKSVLNDVKPVFLQQH